MGVLCVFYLCVLCVFCVWYVCVMCVLCVCVMCVLCVPCVWYGVRPLCVMFMSSVSYEFVFYLGVCSARVFSLIVASVRDVSVFCVCHVS